MYFKCVFVIVLKKEGITVQDWLKQIDDNTPVCDINLPGTHDSAARFVLLSYFARCQNRSITEQLNMGIRFFDLRVEAVGDRLKLVHSIIDCRKTRFGSEKLYMDDVLAQMFAFLEAHPSEAIFLLFKHDDGAVPPPATFKLFYERHVARETRFFTENRLPLLGEVRGRIVLLNRCNAAECGEEFDDGSSGVNLANWPEQGGYYEDWDHDTPICDVRQSSVKATFYLQDFYLLPPKKKWEEAILPTLTNARSHEGLVLNYFSASHGVLGPRAYEAVIRRKAAKFEPETGRKYGWLILDFPNEETVGRIIRSNRV